MGELPQQHPFSFRRNQFVLGCNQVSDGTVRTRVYELMIRIRND